MPLFIVNNDITKMNCDAIVNAANNSLLGGGGVDGAIHRAAGSGLLAECRTLGGCETGDAKITGGYCLPAKYVIHTVGPVWHGGGYGEREKLVSCYRRSLELAYENGCESVAFPLISAGAYGYPRQDVIAAASETIKEFLRDRDMLVYIVVYGSPSPVITPDELSGLKKYIDSFRVNEKEKNAFFRPLAKLQKRGSFAADIAGCAEPCAVCAEEDASLADAVKSLDESFSEMLLRKIDEKGMTDSECYKKANVDRRHFSKIRGDRFYRPGKSTAIAFAIALELPLDEMKDMLMKAGYALSHSSVSDIIVEYFVKNGNYDIFEINEALFSFDQALLGV